MLTYINIKNFAIIKEIELDLQSEMTTLTGETGAGKSIIIDSLELALGARADNSLIYHNAERCEITVIFDIANLPHIQDLLIAQELDSGSECILRRTITKDGRSKSSINGIQCTQQILRSITQHLLNIHGQHEHQALLNPERQRELLDAFIENKTLVTQVKESYYSWFKIKKELVELENCAQDYLSKIDFLTFQLSELEGFDFSSDNIEQLRAEQKRLSNIQQTATNLNSAIDLINDGDSQTIISSLYKVQNQLEKCLENDPSINNTIELIQNAIIQVQEAKSNLQHSLYSLELDDNKHKEVEEQLTHIFNLSHKHQVQPHELPQIQENIEQQLQYLQTITSQLEKTKAASIEAEKTYLEAAQELSAQRAIIAEQLTQAITEEFHLLEMTGGEFHVNVIPNANNGFSPYGLEQIEFLISTNPGQPLLPLNKIASGGELSRISLAIQVITAEKKVTPTLIFDEIDAGIGGKTADIVGQLLRKLSQKTQVICITHLPQIASQGQHHFFIEKIVDNKETEIKIKALTQNERINEIARMVGGIKITKETLAHAKEMLNAAI